MGSTDVVCDKQLALMEKYAYKEIGPVVFAYTAWVLQEARKRGLRRLYFLARDGYLPWQVARMICHTQKWEIECRYLYCSRYALRIPTYSFLEEEMYDLLLYHSVSVTPRSMLQRGGLTRVERQMLYAQLGIADENRQLSEREFRSMTKALRENTDFRKMVLGHAKRAYPKIIAYLRQEELFEQENIAIVDSGWTGSMQRSLRQLLVSAGYDGALIGFYFGLFAPPKSPHDGTYLTFYFDHRSHLCRKALFSNNLLECMLSADHGMTTGYRFRNGIVEPVFAPAPQGRMGKLVNVQIERVLAHAQEAVKAFVPAAYDAEYAQKRCFQQLKRCMVKPTVGEVEMYSHFLFCDDVYEGYKQSLSDPSLRRYLSDYLVVNRVFRKLFRRKKSGYANFLWPYGVVVSCSPSLQPWYRFNIFLWEWLKYARIR